MPSKKRERHGPFVVTGPEHLSPAGIICANCENQLTVFHRDIGRHVPSCEELIEAGAIAWPNFGWFCSSACEDAYAKEYGVRLERVAKSS
jgi:hypothetical protein